MSSAYYTAAYTAATYTAPHTLSGSVCRPAPRELPGAPRTAYTTARVYYLAAHAAPV